ncbi:Tryptophan--tRNA ligase [Koleobacter methoxysyntrophicus]|uniref:Tryptophan--tRNA ligase n=2 Tax=Koleobacter methoxysyntrophicus TaxID=2751313 RepID=A0A8A0RKF8_9FIRM|nr:Tryptophan--tRNA ligase [Koleobacter methoxysyntrophicus]
MKMKRVFSGIQPTGILTLGNYLGAMKQWVALQETHDCFYCVVNLHAMTVMPDAEELRENTLSVAAMLVAAGLDPDKVTLFVQSDVAEHAELGWLLQCMATFGELSRMTQFKEKSREKEVITGGLFSYPALMAADILLYNTHLVPVGEDQRQHLELTRDIAQRFNNRYGGLFTLPEPFIPEVGGRIMSLDDPEKKMSKSNPNPNSYIGLLDPPDTIRQKIMRAVTDSGREIYYDPENKGAVSNLLTIYSLCSGKTIEALEKDYEGRGYGEFKKDLAEVVVECLKPIQARYNELKESGNINEILKKGAGKARAVAAPMMDKVRELMGLKV